MAQARLISHTQTSQSLPECLARITAKIEKSGDSPYASVADKLKILAQLAEFDFGRFVLQNQGVNGYWTHYFLTHPWFGRKTGLNNQGQSFTDLERFLLDRAPIILATQERFEIFLRENQKSVNEQAKLACIPSGLMGELLYLDYAQVQSIELVGIDLDADTLKDAKRLAEQRELSKFCRYENRNAWDLNCENEFDLISSNGLNIYEADDENVVALYQQFHKALKKGGKLVTSFLTPPPMMTDQCQWDMSVLDPKDLLLQKIIFADIIDAKFQCYRSTATTRTQLERAGFGEIEFIYDRGRVFPTVVAVK